MTSSVNKISLWGMLLFWIVACCLLSGIVATVANMPSLWGGSRSVLEYMLPLPFTWGMLHYPSLALFGTGLAFALILRGRWLRMFRWLCLGTILAVICVAIFKNSIIGFPLFMYIVVDAVAALLFAELIQDETDEFNQLDRSLVLSLLLGPGVLVIFAIYVSPFLMDRYNFAKSDTEDVNANYDIVRFWVYLNHSGKDAAKECRHLKKYASTRQNSYPRKNGMRHRKILLFKNQQAYRNGSEGAAWVTYEWWPDGRVYCSADPEFK